MKLYGLEEFRTNRDFLPEHIAIELIGSLSNVRQQVSFEDLAKTYISVQCDDDMKGPQVTLFIYDSSVGEYTTRWLTNFPILSQMAEVVKFYTPSLLRSAMLKEIKRVIDNEECWYMLSTVYGLSEHDLGILLTADDFSIANEQQLFNMLGYTPGGYTPPEQRPFMPDQTTFELAHWEDYIRLNGDTYVALYPQNGTRHVTFDIAHFKDTVVPATLGIARP